MTQDAGRAGVALQEPPPQRRESRRATRPAGNRGAPRRRRWPGPARLLPWLDALALLLVLGPRSGGALAGLAAAGCAVAVHAAAGLHRPRLTRSVLDDLPVLLGGTTAGAVAATVLSAPPYPLVRILGLAAAATAATVALHLVADPLERRHRRRGPACPTVILGTAAVSTELGRVLLSEPRYGLRPVGYLDEPGAAEGRDLPAPLLGHSRDLDGVIGALGVQCVLVAFGASRPAQLVQLLRDCERHRVQVLYVPRFHELRHAARNTDAVGGIPLVRLPAAARYRPSWRLKRVTDVVVASLGLILAAPVLALCALALRWESGPGVLFRQERVGMDDRRFTLFKLRTLRPSSEWESRTRWSVADDPRLGPVGRLLRAASLDELPQLANVLRGEMSMVGPRPERPFFVAEFSARFPGYAARHRVPAGVTGWAAVNGLRGDTSIRTRADYDNSYIENWSLWLDVKILLRTIGAVLVRSGG